MTKVFLRVYNREIEGLIEGSQLDEAIAHCQHILKTFPMYLETYRLLGKTFLEARRYGDAADIFQRALMAVPDDFVSHVGMSIIRDDEGKLDDAIWHMERAFEIQPSNSAIQSELRRLYGRRDGVEPPKIRLSRDALANMYSQGELFNQAIAEIRAVLADDPNRPDLQVMLARAYYKAGQKVEAAEMAAALLKKFPYCMDALKVLVEVLPGTTQGENTQIYRHRLGMLDPYSVFAKDSVFATDQVGDAAVSIERLDYKPGTAAAAAQPDWASSLGIKLGTEKKAEATPDWLQPGAATPPPAIPSPTEGLTTPTGSSDALPDWMKSAGWAPSSGAAEIPPEDISAEPPAEPLAQAEIPEWLKSMAPASIPEPEASTGGPMPDFPSDDDGDIPDWLKPVNKAEPEPEMGDTRPMQVAAPVVTPPVNPVVPAAEEVEVPDWLKSLAPEEPASTTVQGAPEIPAAEQAQEPAAEAEVPDWLKSIAPETPADIPAQAAPEPPAAEPAQEPAAEAEVPGWLKSLAPEMPADIPVQAALEPPAAEPAAEPATEAEVPDWLKSLAPETPVDAASTVEPATPEAAQEPAAEADIPDWLAGLTPAAAETPVIPPETSSAEEPAPAMEADIPDWLKTSVPGQPASESPLVSEASTDTTPAPPEMAAPEPAEEFEMPDWLKSAAPQTLAEPEKAELPVMEAPAPVESQPEMAETLPAESTDMPDWLKGLAPQAEEPQLVEAAQPTPAADLPDWLQSLGPETPVEEAKAELPDTQPTEAVSLSRGTEPQPAEPGALPDWLSSLEAGEPPAMEATQPGATAETMPTSIESIPSAAEVPVDQAPAAQEPAMPEVSSEVTSEKPVEGFVPTGEAKKLDIGDDTLGWLESLAAKQGANPDELLTKPQERTESMPDWLASTEEPKPADLPKEPLQTLPLPSLDAYIKRDATRQPLETLPLRPIDILGSDSFNGPKIHPEETPAPTEPPAAQEPTPEPASISEPDEPKASQPVKIEDDALAWLESLAANQGAKPEELLTKPEERSQTPPEWVQAASQKSAAQAEVPADIKAEEPTLSQTTAEMPAEVVSQENAPAVEPPADAMTELVEPPQATLETPGQLEPKPVEADQPAAEFVEEPATVPVEEPESAVVPAEEDITVTTFLSQIKAEELGIETPAAEPAIAETPASQEELPDWLRDVETPAAAETPPAAAGPESDLPDWLRTPAETPTEEPVEAHEAEAFEPASEAHVEAESLPAWMEEPATTSAAAPTEPDEWIPIDEYKEPSQEAKAEEECPPPPSIEEGAGEPAVISGAWAPIPIDDQDANCLAAAQAALERNSLDEAMAEYEKLVRKGSLLDEVIYDLREATYRFPVDVIVWQMLGDAYMRANRLQDALDAYTKAEELLR
jgi:tetratricopeptide (TPR) repeat protein